METPHEEQRPSASTLIHIEKLVYRGTGLARVNGQVAFVPFVLPGEDVRASLHRFKSDVLNGRASEIVTASPRRTAAPCPYFETCGGCQYQHAAYDYQVEQKREILREVLARLGHVEYSGTIGTLSAEPWGYRNRVQVHVERGAVGYFEYGSHRLCAIDHCPISSPRLNEAIRTLATGLPTLPAFNGAVELFTNEEQVQVNMRERWPARPLALLNSIGTASPLEYAGLRVSRNSFFQVNRFLVERLVETAIDDARGETALDLYAGVGLFALRLAWRFRNVVAVESGASACRDLEFNARRAAANITTVQANVEDYLSHLETAPEFVIADPPRGGLGPVATRELARLAPPRMALVSCDPATLARDIRGLLDSGYEIEKLTMVDLFPQTYHMETVVHLVRR